MSVTVLAHEIQHQVQRARVRSWVLIGLAAINAAAVALIAGGATGTLQWTLVATGVFVLWVVVAYFFYARMVLSGTGARMLSSAERQRIEPIVARLTPRMNVPIPQLRAMDDDAANAFAVGHSPEQATVVVTSGLLRIMDDDQLEGILAHELAHIANRDTRTVLITAGVMGWAVVLSAVTVFLAIGVTAAGVAMLTDSDGDDDLGSFFARIAISLSLIAGGILAFLASQTWVLLARLADLGISRQREWIADAHAAWVTGKPLALVSALEKLMTHDVELRQGGRMAQALCIAGRPRQGSWLRDLFNTHPDLERRIERLKSYAFTGRFE